MLNDNSTETCFDRLTGSTGSQNLKIQVSIAEHPHGTTESLDKLHDLRGGRSAKTSSADCGDPRSLGCMVPSWRNF